MSDAHVETTAAVAVEEQHVAAAVTVDIAVDEHTAIPSVETSAVAHTEVAVEHEAKSAATVAAVVEPVAATATMSRVGRLIHRFERLSYGTAKIFRFRRGSTTATEAAPAAATAAEKVPHDSAIAQPKTANTEAAENSSGSSSPTNADGDQHDSITDPVVAATAVAVVTEPATATEVTAAPAAASKSAPTFPAPAPGREWENGVLDCFSLDITLAACVAPCVMRGKLAEMRGSETSRLQHTICGLLSTPLYPFWACQERSKLRYKLKLEGSIHTDNLAVCFCEPCAITQEYRELRNYARKNAAAAAGAAPAQETMNA